MDRVQKLLDFGDVEFALLRLESIAPYVTRENLWRYHELHGRAFHDLANPMYTAYSFLEAAKADTILRKQRDHLSNYLFLLHYLPDTTAENLRETAKVFNSLFRDVERLKLLPRKAGKIHVAYLVPSLLDSSAARFYEALLTDYDREKFFVSVWDLDGDTANRFRASRGRIERARLVKRQLAFHDAIRSKIDRYVDISGVSYEEAAIQIRDSNADILFDLGGHNVGGMTLQIAAYKPARVQISGIGYFDTTGLDAIDYFLTDDFLAANNRRNFSEKLLTVDRAFAFKPNPAMIRAKNKLNRAAKKNITYGCLNNFMKITDQYIDDVRAILDKNPGSTIIFRDTMPLDSRLDPFFNRIYNAGINTSQFEIRGAEDDFLSDYAEIDLILDTHPYTGGYMTALALYMGVPVVNVCGELHHTRIGADMIRLTGLGDEFVTNDYVDFAASFEPRGDFSIDALTDTKSFVASVYARLEEIANG